MDVIKEKCSRYMRGGKPIHQAARLQDTDFSIIAQYQAEYRGFVQYYLMAYNVHRLGELRWVMEQSLVMTRANKFKTTCRKIYQQYQKPFVVEHGIQKVLVVVIERKDKQPLVARFGGIELRWHKNTILDDQPRMVYNGYRSELVDRLLTQKWELCGTEEGPFQVHHVRKLADLERPGQGEKPPWVKKMASRRRKTLVACQRCHEDIHRERPQQRRSKKSVTGEPR